MIEVEKIKRIKNWERQKRAIISLAREHYLLYEPGEPLFSLFSDFWKFDNKWFDTDDDYLDVCRVYDEVDEFLNPAFPLDYEVPISKRPFRKLWLYAYPIHIGINPRATKRDVLDYINKRWDYIRGVLDYYEENPKGIRKRRKQERDDFIWLNKDSPAKDLAEKVNEKFPDEVLTYSDINSILYYLRKRKSQL